VTTLPVPRAAGLATAPVAAPTVPAGRAQSVKPVAPAPVGAVTAPPASAPTSTSAAPAGASEPPGLSPATVVAQTAGAKTYSPNQVAGNLMAQAVTLDREGRLDEAKQPLRQLLATNPDDLAARQMLVQLDIDTGRLDDARELLEAGLRQHPGNPGLAWTLARLKAESGDVSGAITLLDGVRGGARDDPQLYAFQGALLLRSQRYADAVQAYLAALRADPANPTWLLGVGAALEGAGKTADALEAYKRAEGAAGLTYEQAEFVSSRLTRLRR
jgi:MSHA biogenesis protein MshN